MWFVIPLSHRLLLPAGYLQRKVSTYCSLKYVHTNKRVLSFGTLVGKLAEIDVPRNTFPVLNFQMFPPLQKEVMEKSTAYCQLLSVFQPLRISSDNGITALANEQRC
ncbi:hypothetical protein D918_00979 [Trichuris suis]|nr:hypothetical protein D918_00979 [Trichuris suis]